MKLVKLKHSEKVTFDFKCKRCGKCCRSKGYVSIGSEEINNISKRMDIAKKEFINTYTKKTKDNEIVLKNTKGACIFLKGNVCSIYDVRPDQCKLFPFWPENIISKKKWPALKK